MRRAAGQRGHLREVSTICPDAMVLSSGAVLARCELGRGHGGKHKAGCTRWGGREQAARVNSPYSSGGEAR